MTTYTLTEEQRQTLMAGYESGDVTKYVPALGLLRNLQPNTQEPVAYEFRMRADWVPDWGLWSSCNKKQHEMYIRVPKRHDWIYETRALYTAQQPAEPVHDMPHGWVINWPCPSGGTKPVYHASAVKPKFGAELDGLLTIYAVYTHPAPRQTAEPVNKVLLDALEEAKSGLLWYQANHPESVDGSDDEAMDRIDAAIAGGQQPTEPLELTDDEIEAVCVDVHLKRDFNTNLEKFTAIARGVLAAANAKRKPT